MQDLNPNTIKWLTLGALDSVLKNIEHIYNMKEQVETSTLIASSADKS